MGEMGDPCGMPVLIGLRGCFCPSNAKAKDLSDKNVSIQERTGSGKPNDCKTKSSWVLDTWSKAPLTSIKRAESTLPLHLACCASCTKANNHSLQDPPHNLSQQP